MKSGLRRLKNAVAGPPVSFAPYGSRSNVFNLTGGTSSFSTYLRQYKANSTVFSIVSLLQSSAAGPTWHLYKKQPRDGRTRYTTTDQGSDQRTEVVKHAALSLWNSPNSFMSGFEFRERCNQHEELTGETWWVLDRESVTFPTSMWPIRPDRIEPITDPDSYLLGYVYTSPTGEQVPLEITDVISEMLPDPEDIYRGCGPVASLLPNVQQMRYATEYQRNLFLNSAEPRGVISVPNKLRDNEFKELIARWREGHLGYTRAGRVGVLENGATWTDSHINNRDLEYGTLRTNAREEIREAWRIHGAMIGLSDNINRANAETAKEMFNDDLLVPRLDRRRDTLNFKYLVLFGDDTVEFDYEPPVALDRETDNAELTAKANAVKTLVDAGFDPEEVCETVGLPYMSFVGLTAPSVPASPAEPAPVLPALPASTDDDNDSDDEDDDATIGNYLKHLMGINGHEFQHEGSRR
jgi:HK97 family phage portal protein